MALLSVIRLEWVGHFSVQFNNRTLTSKAGHHMTIIQTLQQTVDLDTDTMIILDALRKQRNVADYSGDIVPESAAAECIAHAENLYEVVNAWIKENGPG